MKRRSFLKNTGTVLSLPVLVNGMNISALTASPLFNSVNTGNGKKLVIIRLNGGNDGLNMLIPIDEQYDNLQFHRSNLLLPKTNYLDLGGGTNLAMHPTMTGLQSVYDDARLKIIHSVAYPNQNRSHFRSTDIWTTASPANEVWSDGWIGRYFDTLHNGYPTNYPNIENPDPIAISIGSSISETCQGVGSNYSLAIKDAELSPLNEGEGGSVPNTPYGDELTYIREILAQTNAYATVIEQAAGAGENLTNYPLSNLGEQLKTVAQLISGGLQTSVYVVSLGGFDTHANQVVEGNEGTGDHANLLQTLSDAIAAFQTDLKLQQLEEQVIGMTFSEFGRQIASNFSLGTDHGTAAPLMLFGSCVNPGILGTNPIIPGQGELDPQEGVAIQHDFRDIYGSILMDWFEVSQPTVESILYDGFTPLPIIQNCSTTLAIDDEQEIVTPKEQKESRALSIAPNPMRYTTQISFYSFGEKVRLSILDALGKEVKVLTDQHLSKGKHQLTFEAHSLPSGNYYCRLKTNRDQQTIKVVKI